MSELYASRTLVKSPPELWAECSDAASLARHLDRFGEIRITRLDPETAVAWEGEHACGTVRIEPAGWGTKVILTATALTRPVEQPVGADSAMRDRVAAERPVEDPVAADGPGGDPVAAHRPVEEPPAARGPAQEPPAPDAPVVPPTPLASPPRARRFARLLAFLRTPGREPESVPVNPAQPAPAAVAPPEPEVVEALLEPEAADSAPAPEAADPAPEPEAADPTPPPDLPRPAGLPDTGAALTAALDSLGQAHHRPYSRA